jgi:hypothetical protein
LKKEFLEDYEARESLDFESYERDLINGTINKYPKLSRFNKIQEPIVRAELFSYMDNEKIWSQIPFAGTLLIPIYNVAKHNFLERHGFEINDLEKLMDLAKETGRVQFGLAKNPTSFQDMDYLDILFEELKPPVLRPLPVEHFTDEKSCELWVDEFLTLAKISYIPWLTTFNDTFIREGDQFLMTFIQSRAGLYANLKAIGLHDVTETIANLLVDSPVEGHHLLSKYMQLTGQKFETLCSVYNQSLSHLNYYDIQPNKTENMVYPVEIGKFIMKKLVLHPTSYQACQDVILHYEQNDLYNVLTALNEAVSKNNHDKTTSNLSNLEIILENTWDDAKKIKQRVSTVQDGISVVLGALGSIASTALTGIPLGGLLASLGFKVAENHLGEKALSQKITQKANDSYLMNIFDFQQKYSLDK